MPSPAFSDLALASRRSITHSDAPHLVQIDDDGRRIVAVRAASFICPALEERPVRICRKCSKQVSDDRKICRDCGAILDEIPDELTPQDVRRRENLELTLESGRTITNPSDEEIARLVPAEEFAILSDGPDSSTYLQFAKEQPWNLMLEYQVDSLGNHFRAADAELTMHRIVAAFQKYAKGDASWKSDFQWEQMKVV